MQDWDRMVLLLIGGGVAIHTLLGAWRAWQSRRKKAAVGLLLLATATAALPLGLLMANG